MTRKYADGNAVEYTAAATHSAGDPVKIGDCIAILANDMVSGDVETAEVEGVFLVTKATGIAWVVGEKIDYDASAGAFTTGITPAAGDVENCGVAYKAAASGDATGYVKLTPGAGTGT